MESTKRFSDRVQNYIKYRPSYPKEMISFLVEQISETNEKVCADIGSGTGILSGLLLPYFKIVYGIEPNLEMRSAAERFLNYPKYKSINGTAENTSLNNKSVDFITAAQAFHWFNQEKFKIECSRILRENGLIALIWNKRLVNTPFLAAYERLMQNYATDYNEINHTNITESQIGFFFDQNYKKIFFVNKQIFNITEMYGRLDSSSYAPKEGTKEFKILREELFSAFTKYAQNDTIDFNYETEVYYGKMK